MRKPTFLLACLLLLEVIGWAWQGQVQAQAQPSDADLRQQAQIVANCSPYEGCQFLIQWKNPIRVDVIRWSFGDGSPIQTVTPEQPAVHYYEKPGKYVVEATIYFPNRAPITVFDTFHIQPLGDPWSRALKAAQNWAVQVGAALVGLILVLKAIGVVA